MSRRKLIQRYEFTNKNNCHTIQEQYKIKTLNKQVNVRIYIFFRSMTVGQKSGCQNNLSQTSDTRQLKGRGIGGRTEVTNEEQQVEEHKAEEKEKE